MTYIVSASGGRRPARVLAVVCALALGSACSSGSSNSATGAGGSGGHGGSGGSTGTGGGGGATGNGGSGGTGGGGAGGQGGGAGAATDAHGDTAPSDGASDSVTPHDAALTDAGAFSRTGWTAVAMPDMVPVGQRNPPSNESLAASNAFDGQNNTRWGTGIFQQNLTFPLMFTVDMKEVVSVGRITLYSGSQDINDFPTQMDVLVSVDGTTFMTAVMAHRPAPPTTGANAGIDSITITPAVTAQFIRLVATQPHSGFWWAIGEMNVYP